MCTILVPERGVIKILFYGDRLRWIRENKGITQGALAEAIGLSTSAIGNYERGYRKPDNPTILKLAEALKVRPEEFAGKMNAGIQEIQLIILLATGEWEVTETLKISESDLIDLAVKADSSVSGTWEIGTTLFIRYDEALVPEKFYLVSVNNLRFLRKAIELNGEYMFIPTSEGFKSFRESEVEVLGRVIGSIKAE